MDYQLENTLGLVDQLKNLRCPVCGGSPEIVVTSETTFKVTTCHPALRELCDQLADEFTVGFEAQQPNKPKFKIKRPPFHEEQ